MKKCLSLLNEKGMIHYKSEIEPYTYSYYGLLCVINKYLNCINIDDKEISICKSKEKNNIKVLKKAISKKLNFINIKNEKIYFYKINDNILLFTYLRYIYLYSDIKYKFKIMSSFNYIPYIEKLIMGEQSKSIKAYYTNRYILSWVSSSIINKIIKKKILDPKYLFKTNNNISFKDKYIHIYNSIKKYDNFKDFNKKYKNMIIKANKYIISTKKSKKFILFKNETKIHKL